MPSPCEAQADGLLLGLAQRAHIPRVHAVMQIDMHAATHARMHAHNPIATHAVARTHAHACVGTRADTNTCAASASSERQAHKPTRLVIMESAAGKVPVMTFEANALRHVGGLCTRTRAHAQAAAA